MFIHGYPFVSMNMHASPRISKYSTEASSQEIKLRSKPQHLVVWWTRLTSAVIVSLIIGRRVCPYVVISQLVGRHWGLLSCVLCMCLQCSLIRVWARKDERCMSKGMRWCTCCSFFQNCEVAGGVVNIHTREWQGSASMWRIAPLGYHMLACEQRMDNSSFP